MICKTSKRRMKVEDVLRLKAVSDPRMSPDGSRVVFVVEYLNIEKNKRIKDIWLVRTDGGEPNTLTEDGESTSPRWSPDGESITFKSVKDGKPAIWVMDVEKKSRRFLTEYNMSNASLGETGENLAWSPDGTLIAFISSKGPIDKKSTINVYDKATYRAAKGFSDMKRRHIWVVSTLGYTQPKQLTHGDNDEHSISWSPDGKEICFVSDRTGEDEWSFHTDLWAVSVKTRDIRRITETLSAEFQSAWSPDGKRIAYSAFKRDEMCNDSNPEDKHVWIINSNGTGATDLTTKLDRRCTDPKWSPDGEKLFFTAGDHGRRMIYSVSPQGGKITTVVQGNRTITSINVATKANKMVYICNDSSNPGKLYISNLDGSEEVQLTHFNDDFVNDIYMSEVEEFTFQSFDGKTIQGWIMKPPEFESVKKYPLTLHVHGGPHGMVGYSFRDMFQIVASHGYVLAFINVRGSSGYGQEFSDGCVQDMGGGDYKDYMKGVDYLLATRKYIDSDKMGVWGGSYGGYMTNWIITQTDRFKAAVSMYPITNMVTMYTTNAPSWVDVEFCGPLWDKMDLILKSSPIMYVKDAKTPTLFLQGELDSVCPLVETEQMFMALRRLKVDSEMVIYAGEGHGIRGKPEHYLDVRRRLIAWLDKYLKK